MPSSKYEISKGPFNLEAYEEVRTHFATAYYNTTINLEIFVVKIFS